MLRAIEYGLMVVLSFIVTWNVHPFIAGFWAAILCWAAIEHITAWKSEGENDGVE